MLVVYGNHFHHFLISFAAPSAPHSIFMNKSVTNYCHSAPIVIACLFFHRMTQKLVYLPPIGLDRVLARLRTTHEALGGWLCQFFFVYALAQVWSALSAFFFMFV